MTIHFRHPRDPRLNLVYREYDGLVFWRHFNSRYERQSKYKTIEEARANLLELGYAITSEEE